MLVNKELSMLVHLELSTLLTPKKQIDKFQEGFFDDRIWRQADAQSLQVIRKPVCLSYAKEFGVKS